MAVLSDLGLFVTEGRSGGRSPERSPGVTKRPRFDEHGHRIRLLGDKLDADLEFPVFWLRLEVIAQLDLASICQISRQFVKVCVPLQSC